MFSSLKMNPQLILIIITMITTTTNTIKASKEFNVGDDSGWQVPLKNNSNMYLKWTDKNTFHVGDSLVFKYENNSVVMVDKRGYYHCNHSSHDRVFDDGNTVFVLDKPGFYYFESGDFQHCKNGQRLMINVKDSNLKVSSFGVISSSFSPFLVLLVLIISTVTGLDLIHAMTHYTPI